MASILDTCLKDIQTRNWALKLNHFEVDTNAYTTIQRLSYEPWREWIGAAIAPFDNCLIEWKTWNMLQAISNLGGSIGGSIYNANLPKDLVERTGIIIKNNKIIFVILMYNKIFVMPFVLNLDLTSDNSSTQHLYEETVYGINYKKVNGSCPPFLLDDITNHGNLFTFDYENLRKMKTYEFLSECAGDARTALAILAYINADKKQEQVFVQRKKSTLIGTNIYPYPKTNLVIIRPGSTQRIYEREERHDPLNNRRLHEVRSHVRKLKTGKCVIVRPHKRGNAELGEVTKRYIVERDPNG